MPWADAVDCISCEKNVVWQVRNGVWTCMECKTPMATKAIKEYQHRVDVENWLDAERQWLHSETVSAND